MSIRIVLTLCVLFALSSLILGSNNNVKNSSQCSDSRCKTRSCNTTGACICDLPDPSTFLDGDRPFHGGQFCDEKMIMCDGTNSFWCERGGTCQEIVQGENYTCNCLPGYTGDHCEHSGAPCGKIFCFHQAECLVEAEGDICQCPPNWKGSVDCSVPTKPTTESSKNSTVKGMTQKNSSSGSTNGVVVGLAITCSIGVVAGGAFYAKKFFSKNETTAPNFHQLSEMQTHHILDDDDDDNEEQLVTAQANHNGNPHLV